MEQLTRRQQQIYDFIEATLAESGYPPTRAEIASTFGFRSPNAAEEHLRALARKGAIRIIQGVSRGIQLTERRPAAGLLPLVGQVAAGAPILAVENIVGEHRVDPALFRPQADYLLHVRGMSMRDAGIENGDLLAVHRTQEAHNRQVVVARLDDEVTVKRWEKRGNRIRLLPDNPDFSPIEVDPEKHELQIEGLAVGVIRRDIPG